MRVRSYLKRPALITRPTTYTLIRKKILFPGLSACLESEINLKNVLKRYCFLIVLCLCLFEPAAGFAQDIQLKSRFLSDTVKVGEPVLLAFSVRYPRQMDVLLPDSSFNFAPFEYVEKTYYPTRSDSVYSTDSVVYTLATFELDAQQQLRVPAYIIQQKDSNIVFAEPAGLRVSEMIPVLTDSAAFVENTSYVEVPKEVNYPYLIAGAVLALIVLVVLFMFFGKPIQRYFTIYRLKRSYRRYEKEYQQSLSDYEARKQEIRPETLLNIWKQYMEQLDQIPYTKLTSKEIAALQSNGTNLHHILRPIDRGIYGRLSENRMAQSFMDLHQVARTRYQQKIKEVRHA